MREKIGGSYIGITGFMSREEVRAVGEVVPPGGHRLMVGVLMSSKTLAGFSNKWPGRFPKREAIADIFIDHPRMLNLIHYSTDEPKTLFAQLQEAMMFGGPLLDGFQLNVAWPPVSEIRKFRLAHPKQFIVLQVGKKAMAAIEESPDRLAAMVSLYALSPHASFIDAVLIDPSGGRGECFPAGQCREYLRALQAGIPHIDLGVAGGLSAETLDTLCPASEYTDGIIEEFPYINLDAEGRLRTPQPEDALNIEAAKKYLMKAYDIFETFRHV